MSTTSYEIYEFFTSYMEYYYQTLDDVLFYDTLQNRLISKGFYLCMLDDNEYMIGLLPGCAQRILNEQYEKLMRKDSELTYCRFNDEIMIAGNGIVLAIYLQSKSTFIDILKYLSIDHPKHCVFLVDGFQGWNELNDELIHHETCFLGGIVCKNYTLHNIKQCNELTLSIRAGNQICLPGLEHTHFDNVEIRYIPQETDFTFGIMPRNYDFVKIHAGSFDSWNKCYEQHLITDEFIQKITSLQIYSNETINHSAFFIRLLSLSPLTNLSCNLKIHNSDDLQLLELILTNTNLRYINLNIVSINKFMTSQMRILVNDNIQQLTITKHSQMSVPLTLCFSSMSCLNHLKASFRVEMYNDLLNNLTYINIFCDDALRSFASILRVNPQDLAIALCKRDTIRSIEIRSGKFKLCSPDLDECFNVSKITLRYANQIIIDSETSSNIQQNKTRIKSLVEYST